MMRPILTVPIAAGETLLQAALAAGIDAPNSCTEGRCGTCMAWLRNGDVSIDMGVFHLLKNQPSPELVEGRGGYGFDKLSLRLFVLKADETHPFELPLMRKVISGTM